AESSQLREPDSSGHLLSKQLIVGIHGRQGALVACQLTHFDPFWPHPFKLFFLDQIAHSGEITAAKSERLADRLFKSLVSVLAPQLHQFDHCARPFLLPIPLDQLPPYGVVTGRPAAQPAPLLERSRTPQRPGLALQDLQVVLEVERLLVHSISSLVARHAPPFLPDLDLRRVRLCPDSAARPHR